MTVYDDLKANVTKTLVSVKVKALAIRHESCKLKLFVIFMLTRNNLFSAFYKTRQLTKDHRTAFYLSALLGLLS